MRALVFFGSVFVFVFALVPGHADAQLRLTQVDGSFQCHAFVTCEGASGCEEPEPNCIELGADEMVCSDQASAKFELTCCETDLDCGERDKVKGECVYFVDEASDDARIGTCLYPPVFDLCLGDVELPSFSSVLGCFEHATDDLRSLAERYRVGDCDGDGIANEDDPCPCSPDDACLLVDGDGGLVDPTSAGISGGGGCSASPSPGALALALIVGASFVRRRRTRRSL
jgi:uncharacterized protein (TIGR03382 family)